MERRTDPYNLGHWSYSLLRGKGKKRILIVTGYRVSTDLSGPMTATMQQYRKISTSARSQGNTNRPRPHRQFILDLQAWLEEKINAGMEIILSIDSNEEFKPSAGTITPLSYQEDTHISHPTHDGTITTLCKSCSLIDPFTILPTHSSPPPTYIRGKSRLDYIFISLSLFPAVTQAGILPSNTIFFGEHRPCYLDF
jgi:exonuclease III